MRGLTGARLLALGSVVLFGLAAVGVTPAGVDLLPLGLAALASSFLVA